MLSRYLRYLLALTMSPNRRRLQPFSRRTTFRERKVHRAAIALDSPDVSNVAHHNVLSSAPPAAPETRRESICIPIRGPADASEIPFLAKACDAGRPHGKARHKEKDKATISPNPKRKPNERGRLAPDYMMIYRSQNNADRQRAFRAQKHEVSPIGKEKSKLLPDVLQYVRSNAQRIVYLYISVIVARGSLCRESIRQRPDTL